MFILDRLGTASRGKASVILLSGEPGVGKTRLLLEAAGQAESKGWRVLLGHAYDSEGMPPYLPFIEALQDYVRRCPIHELTDQLGAGAGDVALFLPDVRRRLPDLQEPPADDADSLRYRLFESVCDFFFAIALSAPSGLLICLDDLQWADNSTLLLLEHLARRLTDGRLLIIATYRDTDLDEARPLARTLEQFTRERLAQRLDVKCLDRDEVGEVLAALGRPDPPAPLVEAVFVETEGNPFFVHEVFEYLKEGGRLFDTDGNWRSDLQIDEMDVPQGVRLIIGRRLERLSEECRSVLSLASVLGRTFAYELLERLADLDREVLLAVLEEAERAQLLLSDTKGSLTFVHELIRQTLLSGLTALRRQRLHLRAAEAIEAAYLQSLGPHLAALAMHYRLAGGAADPEKAIDYSVRAAEASRAVYAWDESVSHYRWALDALERAGHQDESRHCDLLLALSEALIAAGGKDTVFDDVVPKALALAESLGDRARAFAACQVALLANPARPWRWLDIAERYVGDDAQARITLNRSKAVRCIQEGRFPEARTLLLEALALARSVNDPGAELSIASWLMRLGLLAADEERQLFDETRGLPREGTHTQDQADIILDAIMTLLQWGDRAKAEMERLELANVARQSRHQIARMTSSSAEALFATLDGRLHDALEATIAASMGTFPRIWRGRIAAWLGDKAALDKELAWNEGFNSYLSPPYRAFFLAGAGRLGEARDALARLPLTAKSPHQPSLAYATVVLEAAALSRERTVAPIVLELLRGDDRRLASPFFVLVPRHLATLAALMGDFHQAKAGYFEAIDFCERIGYRPELALTRLDLAQLLLNHARAPSTSSRPGESPPEIGQAPEPAHRPAGSPRVEREQERAAAFAHLDLAIVDLEAMGMQPALERALRLRGRRRADSAPETPANADGLSRREIEVLRLIAGGRSNLQIAEDLVLSIRTVERHINHIYAKAGLNSKAQATAYALRQNLN